MKRLIIVALLALLLIACGQTGTAWVTTHSFTGNGSKNTESFDVPGDWKITWVCDPSSFQGVPYNIAIQVYNSDGSLADAGINTLCQSGNTQGDTEIHMSGTVYLGVISEASWGIIVQEWK